MCTPALIQATAVTRKRYGHVLAILTALALSITGCTTHDLAETSPAQTQRDRTAITETVLKYFDAYNTGDVAELNKNSCVAAQRTDATPPSFPTILHDIGIPTITGDAASVPVTMSIESSDPPTTSSTVTIPLVGDDGSWTLCLLERPSNG